MQADTNAIILGSNRGTRHLDNTRSSPLSLEVVDSNRTVLDWILHSLSVCGIEKVTYVGGYHIQKVIDRYPGLDYRFQSDWQSAGEVAALRFAPLAQPMDCFVIRSSTICVPEALGRMINLDSNLSAGYYGNGGEQRFVGLIALSAAQAEEAFAAAHSITERNPSSNLEEWMSAMAEQGLSIRSVDLDTLAAPVDDSIAVARTVFSGKGRTLEQIGPLIRSGTVLDQVRFSAGEWLGGNESIIADIQRSFANVDVVVRSSAFAEDGLDGSLAGRFASVLDVPTAEAKRLSLAVDQVVESFRSDGREIHNLDEVLVQQSLSDLEASGVLLTRDMETGAPYYVINIDRDSGHSDLVTSGGEAKIDTFYVSHNVNISRLESDTRACVTLARELEELTHLDVLDIEFGIDRSGAVYLFQVRPLARRARKFQLADDDLVDELDRVCEFLDAHLQPHPMLMGDTTVLGTMPDWNPAEMIGTAPRPLALSLYQRLIGDRAWATARVLTGYRDVRPEPLIVSLAGRPYVDVRACLNSFLPDGLDDAVAGSWVNHCLRMLRQDSRLHDKIEFEVAITCLAFDFDDHAERLRDAGLSEAAIKEFRAQLLSLTDDLLTERVSPIESQRVLLEEMRHRRERWLENSELDTSALARRINVLLVDCEHYGVVPFAVLARYAFIAMNLLRSLTRVGVISKDEYETLLSSIPTVASDLSRDMKAHAAGRLSTEALVRSYGHLRPSSYDITSPNYASALNVYVDDSGRSNTEAAYPDVSVAAGIFDAHATEIGALMRKAGFTAEVDQLRSFILRSIPSREWAKFEFMKSVDAALEGIALLGLEMGFSREEMSFLPVDLVVRGAKESANNAFGTELRRTIEFNKKRWNLTCAIRLPHLVCSKSDVFDFHMEEWTPNFISTQRVVAPTVVLEAGLPVESLEGRIVLIRAADPGYDWIFSHRIAGLITEFGGVASHMAIRAAEFGLPAAIGCGELVFDRLRSARLVELDCTSKKVRAV